MIGPRSVLIPVIFGIFITASCPAQKTCWFRSFTGIIDKYPVTIHLYKTGHAYDGCYYYNSRQELIFFNGEDSTKRDSIRLISYLPDQETIEYFTFSLEENRLRGQWTTTTMTRIRTYPFSATRDSTASLFDYIYTEGSALLRPRLKGSPTASFAMESIWPKGNSSRDLLFKKIITESFGEKDSSEDIGKIFLRQKKKFFAGYIDDNKDLKDEDVADSYSYSSDVSDDMQLVYQSSSLVVFAHSNYVYTGGAHGMYGTSYYPVDILANKKIELNSIMTAAGKQQLPRLLEKYFRKIYVLKPADSLTGGGLFDNKIEPNDNFYVTTKGICFCYLPYEIASYALGEIKVFIPFTELTAYLKPEFRKLVQ